LDDLLRLTSLCDVMLDPIHFGGGNTSYEAFAFGVPIVTLPSRFLRGRITKAQYDLLGIDDCIATSPEHYIDIANRLGTDAVFRKLISDKILAAAPAIFE